MPKLTLGNLATEIPTEGDAYIYLESLRWPEKPVCPHCGVMNDHYYLEPENGYSRTTTRGSESERRVWKCKDCRKQFSATTGTVFHGSKVPLRTWLFVFFEMCCNKNGIAAREIARKYGVAPKTAWFMTQRIREAMMNDSTGKLSGNIVADETFFGGDVKNWHKNDPRRAGFDGGNVTPYKTPVVALIEAETGEIRAKVITTVSGPRIRKIIQDNVELRNSTLHTDSAPVYRAIGKEMAAHHVVNHTVGQYVTELSDGTNKAENFFSQLKRSIDGTHHNVSPEHLHRYVSEFAFRHSTHMISDEARMTRLMGQVYGRRMTYKTVTGL
ncbi:MAG: IS1595 family transposase [Acidimicrobiales bacterium]